MSPRCTTFSGLAVCLLAFGGVVTALAALPLAAPATISSPDFTILLGMGLVIISGGIDLSVGSLMALFGTVFFFLLTVSLLQFSGGAKAILSLANIMLIIIPLVSLLFGTIYLYNARNFVQMLLVQPVSREQMFFGLYLGLAFQPHIDVIADE